MLLLRNFLCLCLFCLLVQNKMCGRSMCSKPNLGKAKRSREPGTEKEEVAHQLSTSRSSVFNTKRSKTEQKIFGSEAHKKAKQNKHQS
jgi:hypothetical protein